jgi:hypothetical protein
MPRSIVVVRSRLVLLGASLVLLVAMTAVLAPAARADCDDVRWELRNQWNPFGTGLSLVRVPVCHDFTSPATKPRKARAKPEQPTRRQLRALRFRPSAAVSADVRERLLTELVGDAQGPDADTGREMIASGNLLAQFHSALRRQRWSTRDVGDMYALAYIHCWMGVHEKPRLSNAIAAGVRKDLRRQLALDRGLARGGDAAQQERAEWIGQNTVAMLGAINAATRAGDAESVEWHLDYLRERVDDFDLFRVDLTEIRLTKRGIVRR